jgi:hypothetical protein
MPSVGASTVKIRTVVDVNALFEGPVIAALSIISVVGGTTIAWIAAQYPAYKQIMEAFGGFLLIAGFALLGYLLEETFGPPLGALADCKPASYSQQNPPDRDLSLSACAGRQMQSGAPTPN